MRTGACLGWRAHDAPPPCPGNRAVGAVIRILQGDCRSVLATLPERSVQCCVTSPPYYGLRDYKVAGQIGLENSPDAYIAELVSVFRDIRRALRDDGVLWLNLGDSYHNFRTHMNGGAPTNTLHVGGSRDGMENFGRSNRNRKIEGIKDKDLLMIPARVALALQADGWWLRSQMPWLKRSCMPESVTDRPSSAVEYVFMLTKRERYFWDADAVRQNAAQPDRRRSDKFGGISHVERGQHSEGSTFNGSPSRNFRNSDPFFDSLEPPHGLICNADGTPLALDVNPQSFSDSHFATFPPRLVEPLIRAATSERGACPTCGAPWMRIVTKGAPDEAHKAACRADASGGYNGQSTKNHAAAGVQDASAVKARILAGMRERISEWRQSCGCRVAPPVRCVVLDPFAGAFTTCMVADRLQRNSIGIELNADYCDMARRRLAKDAGMFVEIAP